MTVTARTAQTLSNGCRLVAADGRALPLRKVDVLADAGGGLARVRLRQTFANPYADPLQVTYLLPLPADGAVVDFAFVLAGRRISGRVERKADARATFEQAVLEGRTAALLEQDRSSLFTQELGNVPPGTTIEVEIDVEQLLAWVGSIPAGGPGPSSGGWEWRWPTVVGPRYLGAETPDAERVTVDVLDGPLPVVCSASIAIADALTGAPSSPSHGTVLGDSVALTGLLDRDVVVRWPVAAPDPGVRLEVARPAGDDAYALLTLVPPKLAGAPVARDLCLLLDTSGSMGGQPIAQLQAFSQALVEGLREGDRLEMIEFSNTPRRWREDVVRVDATTRRDALAWIASLRAGGGTAMHTAITLALRPLRAEAERQVVVVTDGYIGFEAEVIGRIRRALPQGSRVHAVGIGSAVNRTLTGGVARAGGGHEAIVAPDEATGPTVRALLARTGDPLWIDVRVSGTAVREAAPRTIPDLLAGAPARVAVRLDPAGGTLVVTARTPSGTVSHTLQIAPAAVGTGRRVVATRFAREAVEDLEVALAGGEPAAGVDAAIEALGLQHRIATRLTSWVAATEEATVDPSDPIRRERMPHLLPHGVSAEGVGLRGGPVAYPAQTLAMPMAPPPPPTGAARGAAAPRRQRAEAPEKLEKDAARLGPPPGAAAPIVATPLSAGPFAAGPVEDGSLADDGWDDLGGASAPAPAEDRPKGADAEQARSEMRPPDEPRRVHALVGRILRRVGDLRVIEIPMPEELRQLGDQLLWDTAEVWLVAADGTRTRAIPQVGTTHTGWLSHGLTARLVVRWTGADPARIQVGELTVELTA